MPTPSNCAVCRVALVEDSQSGLCPTCLRSATPRDPATAGERGSLRSFAAAPVTRPAPPLPNPALAAHRLPAGYVPLALIGQGGMGLVYQVWEPAADRVVALKMLRAVNGPELVARFGVEVKALAALNHPNIVTVFAVDLAAQDPFFTMEFVDGQGLDHRLKEGGPLSADEAARHIETVARAVHAAHRAGVIHRDLKPSNVLVTADGVPKVTDFGVAKRDGLDDRLTVTGMVVGTPAFMAPEQAAGRPVDGRADVYGLGATLFALLTGKAPFAATDPEGVLAKVRSDDPPLPRSLRPDVPPGLEAVVLKCLEKSPRDRYPTAEALADELAAWRAGQTPAAPSVTWRTRVARAVRGRPRLRTAGAAALGCAVLATVLYAAGLFGSPVPKTPNPPDPKAEFLRRVHADLRADKSVVLIGATGMPAWHDSRFFPATLGPSPLGDQTCSFQTADYTLLELLPDPGVDRYRIRTELRHLATMKPPPPNLPSALESIGLYFGGNTRALPSGRPVTTLLAIHYRDVAPNPVAGRKPDPTFVNFKPGAVLSVGADGEKGPGTVWVSGNASLAFAPPNVYPGSWRYLEADVTPDGVTARWAAKPGDLPTPFATWSADETRSRYASLHHRIVAADPAAAALADPAWSPRMAIGVFCRTSAVAVRNFRIEPLP